MPNRIILVTGAATGIGAATCAALATPGTAILAHTRRNADGLARTIAAIEAKGAQALPLLGDLALPETAPALIETARTTFGRLDVLISNAGFADRTQITDLSDEAFARSLDAIQWGFLRLARAAIPALRAAPSPRIVAVSSFVAHSFRTDVPTFPASAAAKAGMEALVRALAVELAPAITVNCVVPGFVRKDTGTHAAVDPEAVRRNLARIPAGRVGEPAEIAAAIAFLASEAAGYITGQALHVDGGLVI